MKAVANIVQERRLLEEVSPAIAGVKNGVEKSLTLVVVKHE